MTGSVATVRGPSEVTVRSRAFVDAHRAEAVAMGTRVAEFVHDPERFAAEVRAGLELLGDEESAAGERFVAPGLGPVFGVRLPLLEAVHRAFRAATRDLPSALLVSAVDRLLREEIREIRWLALWNLERTLASDPERTWQLLRRSAQAADEWITVDTLAHPYAAGILLDRRRWAELEQLVYSPSRWERRLVGSTLATIPFEDKGHAASAEIVDRGLELVAQLIGDDQPDVQKALSWALRALAKLDVERVIAFCDDESARAAMTADGHRAWVIRDSLSKLPPADADRIRRRLDGIRRRPGGGPTSRASAIAAEFLGALPASPAEPRAAT